MQYIFIQDLRVDTIIGVYAEERLQTQTLRLDLEVGIPNRLAFATDDIDDTVDYAKVADAVRAELAEQHCETLERLAQQVCQRIVREFAAPWVRIRVAKSGIVPGAAQVGVVLEHGMPSVPSVKALFGESFAALR